jgi:hypothetical protein
LLPIILSKSFSSVNLGEELVENVERNIKKGIMDYIDVNSLNVNDGNENNLFTLFNSIAEVQTVLNVLCGIHINKDDENVQKSSSNLYFLELFQYALEVVDKICKKTESYGRSCDSGFILFFFFYDICRK